MWMIANINFHILNLEGYLEDAIACVDEIFCRFKQSFSGKKKQGKRKTTSLKFLAGYSLTHFGRLQQAGALLLAMGSWCRRAAASRTPSRQCCLALRLATRRRPDGNDACPRL